MAPLTSLMFSNAAFKDLLDSLCFDCIIMYHHLFTMPPSNFMHQRLVLSGISLEHFSLKGHNVKTLANTLCKVQKACNIWKRRPKIEFHSSVLLFSPNSANLRNVSKLLFLIGQMVALTLKIETTSPPKDKTYKQCTSYHLYS